ncbi:MAG: hypothetical protein KJS97_00410 [Alphaproteobacteria bacterium]|nr:hypothetical protein [Alphaproteobacteria bacterium]
MKHRTLEDLLVEADVAVATPLTRREKLTRWADLLASLNLKSLSTLPSVEYMPKPERLGLRKENSAISVAFADPVLRNAGLRDDTYGAALEFFELSHGQLHRLTCRCHYGVSAPAERVSRRVRGLSTSLMTRVNDVASRLVTATRALFAPV